MSEHLWNAFLTPNDRAVTAAAGYDARIGFGRRPALLIVDANRAFCGDEPLPILEAMKISRSSCGQYAWAAIPTMKRLIERAREREIPVIYTTNTYRQDRWDAGSWTFKKRPAGAHSGQPKPALANGDDIVAPLAPAPRDIMVYKQKPSGFFGTGLTGYLQLLGCDSLIVAGGTTSGCVRATVVDGFSANYRMAVVHDACFDRLQASHALALCDMHSRYADVISADEAIEFMAGFEPGTYPLPSGAGA